MQVYKSIFSSKRLKLIRSSPEFIACLLLEVLSDLLSKADISVEACAYGRTSLSNLIDILKRLSDAFVAVAQLVHVTRKLLAEGQGRGILSMSPTDLYNIVEFSPLGIKRVSKSFKLGQKSLVDFENGGDMHDRGEDII